MQFSKPLGISAFGIAFLLTAGAAALRSNGPQAPSSDQAAYPRTTMPLSRAPRARAVGSVTRIVIIPDSNVAPGVYRFHKNDAVNFLISVPYDGMLSIHGYTSDNPIVANQELKLAVTLQHTGRFPMHVHGKDGQHIEVAVLEILPD